MQTSQARREQKPQLAGPLYIQVADLIRNRIEELEWRPDMAMPNETVLAKEMGVSIGTMRKALDMLEERKFISRRQGRGTFVLPSSFEAELERFERIYRADLVLGGEARMVEVIRRQPSAAEAIRLTLPPASDVIEIERSRRIQGTFATEERLILNGALLGGIEEIAELAEPLLFAVYRRDFHVVVGQAGEAIHPVNADPDLAARLGIPTGTAVLKIDRLAWASSGECVEWSVRHVHVPAAP